MHIHEVVGASQETLHSVKTKNINVFLLKVDLSKAYDRVNWLYLKLLLLQLGMNLQTVNWTMGYLSSVSLAVLIHGSPSIFSLLLEGSNRVVLYLPFSFY